MAAQLMAAPPLLSQPIIEEENPLPIEIEEDTGAVEEDINISQLSVAQKAVKYRQWAQRPNVHIGLHYVEVLRRYGLVSLVMVLPGELKHK
jgi:hypothetical protein